MEINITLLGQAITFFIFVVFTMKYVWPPLMQAMNEREKTIADGLAAAKRGEETLEKAQIEATEVLRKAKDKAGDIIEQANKRASSIVEDSKSLAKEEGQRILAAAKSEIEQERLQVRETLRSEVAKIAVLGAEKVIGKSIDAKVHEDLLNKLAANM